MFLYPTLVFLVSDVSSLSFSSLSDVRGSPPAAVSLDGVVDCGGVKEVGDVERVEGALTAIESVFDAAVDSDALEPVLSNEAANLGRGAEGAVVGVGLMRAAN